MYVASFFSQEEAWLEEVLARLAKLDREGLGGAILNPAP